MAARWGLKVKLLIAIFVQDNEVFGLHAKPVVEKRPQLMSSSVCDNPKFTGTWPKIHDS